MGRQKRAGAPPGSLTGGRRVRSLTSPWWDRTLSEMLLVPGLVGRTLTIEELTEMVPRYPDGNRARAHTVVRRLSPALELVSRGPNGSRARGATYRVILPPGPVGVPLVRADVPDTGITSDLEWLLQQVERMTGGGSK